MQADFQSSTRNLHVWHASLYKFIKKNRTQAYAALFRASLYKNLICMSIKIWRKFRLQISWVRVYDISLETLDLTL